MLEQMRLVTSSMQKIEANQTDITKRLSALESREVTQEQDEAQAAARGYVDELSRRVTNSERAQQGQNE
jgi:hypothetical protein